MNCSDLKKIGEMLVHLELQKSDIDKNYVNTVYNLELIDWMSSFLIPTIALLDRLGG